MSERPAYKEPLSTHLRRYPHGDKSEITETVLWVAITSAFLFLALTTSFLLAKRYPHALVAALGIVPIIVSIFFLRRGAIFYFTLAESQNRS